MDQPFETFLTGLYTIVDDWYQAEGARLLASKPGAKPVFSDSEVLTLSLAQHWCGYTSEREWLRVVRQNFLPLFPRLVSQSEFNRRARNLCRLLNELRRALVCRLGAQRAEYRLIDGTPIHVRHWRRAGRTGRQRLLLPGAALGYCAAKRETFYGYILVVLTTPTGIITDWELIPANAPEREAALDLLEPYRHLRVLGDKGYLDRRRQEWLATHHDNHLFTPKRQNQEPLPPAWERLLLRVRKRIETAIAQAKTVFGLERPGARTFWGLGSRLVARLTGLTIAAYVNHQQGRSPLALADFRF